MLLLALPCMLAALEGYTWKAYMMALVRYMLEMAPWLGNLFSVGCYILASLLVDMKVLVLVSWEQVLEQNKPFSFALVGYMPELL